MANATPLAWDTTYDESWAAAVGTWDWTWDGEDTVRLRGNCPRCGHLMTREVVRTAVRLLLAMPKGVSDPVPVVVACNCVDSHAGRPEGQLGCGKQATFKLPI